MNRTSKILSVLLLVLSCSLAANAQRNRVDDDHENFFRIGAKAGVNINRVDGKSYKSGFAYNFQGGGFMQFNFSRTFGIQPEVNFVQSQSEFTNDVNTISDDIVGGGTQHKAKLNYLEVPLLLNVNLGPSKRVKLQLGPSYGGLLKQTVDSLKAGSTQSIYKNGEWSAIGGLWLQLPFINLSFRYKYGLSNISNVEGTDKWHNQAIQVGVGFTL